MQAAIRNERASPASRRAHRQRRLHTTVPSEQVASAPVHVIGQLLGSGQRALQLEPTMQFTLAHAAPLVQVTLHDAPGSQRTAQWPSVQVLLQIVPVRQCTLQLALSVQSLLQRVP